MTQRKVLLDGRIMNPSTSDLVEGAEVGFALHTDEGWTGEHRGVIRRSPDGSLRIIGMPIHAVYLSIGTVYPSVPATPTVASLTAALTEIKQAHKDALPHGDYTRFDATYFGTKLHEALAKVGL